MLDADGNSRGSKGRSLRMQSGTTCGACLGTSTVTTFVESASGVTEGGRTGLTSLTTAVLFLLSLLLSPIFLAIPSFATAPALITVGFYMIGSVSGIDFRTRQTGIPAFLCIIAMPFFYSISEESPWSYLLCCNMNLFAGKKRRSLRLCTSWPCSLS